MPDNADETDRFADEIRCTAGLSGIEFESYGVLDGEANDPEYRRFFPRLGLTEYQLLPHYQDTKDLLLDGKRLFEDIMYADSMGHTFYAIPDGSYLYAEDDKTEILGEYYLISDGRIITGNAG